MAENYVSLYRRAAYYGVPVGIVMSVMAVSAIYVDKVSQLAVVVIAMVLLLPCVLYHYERKMYKAEYGFTEYSGLWMLGILTMIYGSLITSFVTLGVFTFLRPGYFYEQAQLCITLYSTSTDPQVQESVTMLKRMVEGNMLPKPIEVVFAAFWLWSFVGSILSALVALVVKRVPVRDARR